LLPRPRFRLPLWVAMAIVALLYLGRSAARGFDFRPDLPLDAIVGVLFVLVVGIVAYLRRLDTSDDDASDAGEERGDNDAAD
jgi:hypothetical protein